MKKTFAIILSFALLFGSAGMTSYQVEATKNISEVGTKNISEVGTKNISEVGTKENKRATVKKKKTPTKRKVTKKEEARQHNMMVTALITLSGIIVLGGGYIYATRSNNGAGNKGFLKFKVFGKDVSLGFH